jgi:hypothetical protein
VTPGGAAATDRIAPVLTLTAARRRLATALRRGLRVGARCSEACRLTYTVRLGSATLARRTARLTRAGTHRLTVRLSRRSRARLARRRSASLRLQVRAVDATGNARTRTVTLRLTR